MLIIIDNYDSFTYNIVQTLATAPPSAPPGWQAPEMRVFRNDAITVDKLAALRPDRLLISPGPCTPAEAGISVAAIRRFAAMTDAVEDIEMTPPRLEDLYRYYAQEGAA